MGLCKTTVVLVILGGHYYSVVRNYTNVKIFLSTVTRLCPFMPEILRIIRVGTSAIRNYMCASRVLGIICIAI